MKAPVPLLLALILSSSASAMDAEAHRRLAEALKAKGRLHDAEMEMRMAERLGATRSVDVVSTIPTGAATEKLRGTLASARASYLSSDLSAAAEAWRRAQLLSPADEEAAAGLKRLDDERYHHDEDQPFDRSVADLYEAGMREARKGRLIEAKVKLDEALALNPVQPQVLVALAGLKDGALQQRAERDARQWLREGEAALKAEDWPTAGRAFQQALAQDPDLKSAADGLAVVKARGSALAEAALQKARAAMQAGQWASAAKEFNLALALDPDLDEAEAGRDQALREEEKTAQAAADALKVDRLYNAGVEAWSSGDLNLAAERFGAVLAVAPDDQEAQKALASVRRKLEQRSAKDKSEALALLEEGKRLESKGAPQEALKRYERALAKDPAQSEAARSKDRLLSELQAP